MQLTSPAFNNGSQIPTKYGYNHENINPPLKIDNVPINTKSLVLIMEDPDALPAVGKIWVHWTLWNISPNTSEIKENSFPSECVQGLNDFRDNGYGGPAPPDKEHTYFFKLYAINKTLELSKDSTKKTLEESFHNNIIENCILTGKYSPKQT